MKPIHVIRVPRLLGEALTLACHSYQAIFQKPRFSGLAAQFGSMFPIVSIRFWAAFLRFHAPRRDEGLQMNLLGLGQNGCAVVNM